MNPKLLYVQVCFNMGGTICPFFKASNRAEVDNIINSEYPHANLIEEYKQYMYEKNGTCTGYKYVLIYKNEGAR